MRGDALDLYEPINVLKPFADEVWIVDGPLIEMKLYGSLPFTTRMTVVRLPDGGLWLHSPTQAAPALLEALAALGAGAPSDRAQPAALLVAARLAAGLS